MKVLIICTSEFGKNGIVSVIMNYYNAMDKSDMNIDFVVINEVDESKKKVFIDNNSNVYVYNRNKNPIRYLHKLINLLKKNKYDIVHVHGNSSTMCVEMIAAVIAKIKVRIAHVHNSTCNHRIINQILKPFFMKMCTHRFACSISAGDWLYGKKEYYILKNSVDTKRFCFNEQMRKVYRQKLAIKEDEFVIGHVGMFNYQKNHELLIDIFDRIVNIDDRNGCFKMLLIGDGELREEIEKKVKNRKLDESVIFINKTDEVEKYMSVMDVMVLPSRFEGFPMVCMEAFCSNMRCVVSDNISKEIDIVNLVEFVNNNNINNYVEKILETKNYDRKSNAKMINQCISDNGYDIKNNAKQLKDMYVKYVND